MKIRRGPATVNGSFLQGATVERWEGGRSDEHEPGDLPVSTTRDSYADRRCLVALKVSLPCLLLSECLLAISTLRGNGVFFYGELYGKG